jgi:lipid-A-disaccharide synthase-like uncharacterized protein
MTLPRPSSEAWWTIVGLFAQFFFFLRFLVQWLSSESKKQSVIPVSFWYFSILGSAGLLSYALHKKDPVFIIGQCAGLLIYARNLQLIRQSAAATSEAD